MTTLTCREGRIVLIDDDGHVWEQTKDAEVCERCGCRGHGPDVFERDGQRRTFDG